MDHIPTPLILAMLTLMAGAQGFQFVWMARIDRQLGQVLTHITGEIK